MSSSKSPIQEAYLFFQEAARQGFDWDSSFQAAEKVKEELEEVLEELNKPASHLQHRALKEELGDLFLACACLALHCDIPPDDAIVIGLEKFKKRFLRFTTYAKKQGISLHETPAEKLITLWKLVKHEDPQEK